MADEFVLGLVDQLAVFLVDEYVFRINDLAALVVQDDLVQGKGQGDVPVGIQFEIIVIHRLVIIERLLVQLVQFDVLIFIFQRSPVCGNFWFRHERMGFAVIKALQLVAADFLQEPGLFFRLHPFHQGVDTQVVGHFHNPFQDDRVLAVGAEAFQELHIQLESGLNDERQIFDLKEYLFGNSGNCAVYFHIDSEGQSFTVKANSQLTAPSSKEFIDTLKDLPFVHEVWTV